jgi:hypothetical protein
MYTKAISIHDGQLAVVQITNCVLHVCVFLKNNHSVTENVLAYSNEVPLPSPNGAQSVRLLSSGNNQSLLFV